MQSCYKIWSDLRLTETPGAWQPHGSGWPRGECLKRIILQIQLLDNAKNIGLDYSLPTPKTCPLGSIHNCRRSTIRACRLWCPLERRRIHKGHFLTRALAMDRMLILQVEIK